MTEREIRSFETKLENVRKHQIMNYQERRGIADLILEGELESDFIQPLVNAITLIDKVDSVLSTLEKIGQLAFEQAQEEKSITSFTH